MPTDKAKPIIAGTLEVKKLLSDAKYKIQLHNLVHRQTVGAYKSVETLTVQNQDVMGEAQKALPRFELATADLRLTTAYGSYFGTKEQAYLWSSTLNQLGTIPQVAGSVFLLKLQLYPALLVLYAGGLSALAANNPDSLRALFNTQSTDKSREPRALVIDANCSMLENAGNQLFGYERRKTPLSDHLFELFTDTLPKELTFGRDFEQLFDDWEILVSMVVADALTNTSRLGDWAPIGRFGWREHYSNNSPLKALNKELSKDKPEWFPLEVGLFGGDVERARKAISIVENLADRVSFF